MINIDQEAVAHIISLHQVDLHDWLVSPDLPLHRSAVACMGIARMVLNARRLERWQSLNDLDAALRLAVAPFTPVK